ncbi:MAG: hypothetical protein GC155_11930 [Alphaproteobacteria bacterium]|nr:hypothetical protein [Alphaproteobacteria bacterium]
MTTITAFATPVHADTAGVERVFLERSAISAADDACNLFTDGERFALKAGLYQSEDELLRANYSQTKIDDTAADVRAHAKSLGCDHPSIRDAAATVRSSYRQFAKTNYLEYNGSHGVWRASRVDGDQWALSEPDKQTGAIFGLRRNGDEAHKLRLAVAIPESDTTASAAQLYIRDPAKLNEPWLGTLFGSNGQLSPPPRSMTTPVWASETDSEDDITGNTYQVYYFSNDAIQRISALDPREAVLLELTPDPRAANQKPVRIAFEVGDFRAAMNFVQIPQQKYSASMDNDH